MTEPLAPDIPDPDAMSRQRLVRVVTWADGFALGFARVNSEPQRRALTEDIISEIADEARVIEVDVAPEETDLESLLRERYEAERESGDRLAFFVYGLGRILSSSRDRSGFLPVLNLKRENLQRSVPCPVILWVPEYALKAIATEAPDFWAWRSGVFDFTTPPEAVDRSWQEVERGGSVDEYARLSPEARRERIQALEALYHDYSEQEDAERPDLLRIRFDLSDRLARLYQDIPDLNAAVACARRALTLAELIGDESSISLALNNLGLMLRESGDLDGAEKAFRRALSFDDATSPTGLITSNLGLVLQAQGDLEGARSAFQRALAIDETKYGSHHPAIAASISNLGNVLHQLGDLDGAERAIRRALAIDGAVYRDQHPVLAHSFNSLGYVLLQRGDLDGAEDAIRRALAIDESSYGPDHPNMARGVNNLGAVLRKRGDLDGAELAHRRALDIMEAYSPNHPNTVTARANLATIRAARDEASGASG